MEKISKPLNKIELNKLTAFLEKGKYLSLMGLHGFLTAVISSPNFIRPSEWLEAIGFNDVTFASKQEAEIVMSNLLLFYNEIANNLAERKFSPLLSLNGIRSLKTAEEIFSAAKQWAHGYMEAVGWNSENWELEDSNDLSDEPNEMATLLFMIMSLVMSDRILKEELKNSKNKNPIEFRLESIKLLPSVVIGIYEYWRDYRGSLPLS